MATDLRIQKRSNADFRRILGLYNGNLSSIPEGKETKEIKEEPKPGSQERPIDVDQDEIETDMDDRDPEDEFDSKDDGDDGNLLYYMSFAHIPICRFADGNFRVAAKNVLITYSKCGDHVSEDLVEHVKCICKEKGWVLKSIIGATEKHADGENHVHIGLKFVVRPNLTRADTFDFPCDCGCGKRFVACTVVALDDFEWNEFVEWGVGGLWTTSAHIARRDNNNSSAM